jgi:hypothetical protein
MTSGNQSSFGSKKNSTGRACAVAIAAGAVIRGTFVFTLLHTPGFGWQWGGEAASIASAIVRGEGFASPYNVSTGPTVLMAPIYPSFLASLLYVAHNPQRAAAMAVGLNVLWSILVCLPLWAIAESHRPRFGYIAAGFWALAPLSGYSGVVYFWDTSLYALTLVLLMWATLRLRADLPAPVWAGYGVFAGLTLLLDPAHSLAWLVALTALTYVRRFRWRRVAVAVATTVVTIAPWCVRNSLVLHRPTYIRAYVGYELLRGLTGDPFDRGTALASNPGRNEAELSSFKELGETAYMRSRGAESWSLLLRRPFGAVVRQTMRRIFVYWTGTSGIRYLYKPAGRFVWLKYLCYTLVGAFALFGIFTLAWSNLDVRLLTLAVAFLGIFPLPYYVALSDPRYRAPIEPLCYVLAIVGFAPYIASRARRTDWQATPSHR